MQNFLNEVSVLPGVVGTCIFDKKDGVMCSSVHEKLADGLLETVGAHIVRLFQLGAMSNLHIKTAQFFFDRYVVIGLPCQDSSVLITLCTPQADCPAITECSAHLAAKLGSSVVSSVEEVQADELESEEIIDKGLYPAQIQAVLCRIEQALAGAIGPVAGMVMQDYIKQWHQRGPAVLTRIAELTDLLVEEIGDPEAAQDFVAKIEKIV